MQGEPVTVQVTHLSAWEFVVYQYGLSILHLLIPQMQVRLPLAFCEAASQEAVEVRVAGKRLSKSSLGRSSYSNELPHSGQLMEAMTAVSNQAF